MVGVVGDVRQESPAENPGPTLYMPMTQHPFYANQIHIVLRTEVKPLTLMNAVHEEIARVNPFIAMRFTTMDAMVNTSIATERFRAALISSFAGIGLVLAMLGVYGTMAYTVAQRTFEIGVRMAFGAERGTILSSGAGACRKVGLLWHCGGAGAECHACAAGDQHAGRRAADGSGQPRCGLVAAVADGAGCGAGAGVEGHSCRSHGGAPVSLACRSPEWSPTLVS